MKFDQVESIIRSGGYICCTEDSRPELYDENNKHICAVPTATMERMAKVDGFAKWKEAWGGEYVARYLGRKYQHAENVDHCHSIADNLAEYVAGSVYKCPECGHEFTAPDDCEKYRCPHCEFTDDLNEYEQQSLYDYMEDCLDIEYRCDSKKEYRSVQIMVAWGGPNIYLDTASGKVELYWGGDNTDWPLSYDVINALDEWAEEYWNL
jgi:predicted RNA-binding Zn-ribbon protein involved in translation (DUF1610 family)